MGAGIIGVVMPTKIHKAPFVAGDRATIKYRVHPFLSGDVIVVHSIEKIGRGKSATWRVYGSADARDASGWLDADNLQLMEGHPLARKSRSRRMRSSAPPAGYHIFQGKETHQIDGETGRRAPPDAWYFEPDDYDGDVLYSRGMASAEEAAIA